MTVDSIYDAVKWLYFHKRAKLTQWINDNFGNASTLQQMVSEMRFGDLAREIAEYDFSVQVQLVNIIYGD